MRYFKLRPGISGYSEALDHEVIYPENFVPHISGTINIAGLVAALPEDWEEVKVIYGGNQGYIFIGDPAEWRGNKGLELERYGIYTGDFRLPGWLHKVEDYAKHHTVWKKVDVKVPEPFDGVDLGYFAGQFAAGGAHPEGALKQAKELIELLKKECQDS